MPTLITDFDELNALVGYEKSIPYSQYFGIMKLPRWKREELIETSKEIEEVMNEAFVFVLLALERNLNIDWNYVRLMIYNGILAVLSKEDTVDIEYQHTLESAVEDMTEITKKKIEEMRNQNDSNKNAYYVSNDRAKLIGENEVNTYFNHQNHLKSKLNGATGKQWDAVMDRATRQSHKDINDTVIGIDDLFNVNGSLMRYPKDRLYGANAGEIINCRCTLTYIFN